MLRHIIESQQFDRQTLHSLFRLADRLKERHDMPLSGKVLASLFYEPSTRTRFSFESAMIRLGGNVITTENAHEFSSAAKGETLEDTIRVVSSYADVIVLRHEEAGASARAASVASVPIINAGDGVGQHPSQALLDLYTIERELGRVDSLHVALVGDLAHGRTARSLAYLLSKYRDVKLSLVSPEPLRIGQDIRDHLKEHNVVFAEERDLRGILSSADVVYQTRIQKERFPSEAEYLEHEGAYVITSKEAAMMKEGSIIMHPLPRVGEIAPEVDASPRAAYFRQARYGVLIRMALLCFVLQCEPEPAV